MTQRPRHSSVDQLINENLKRAYDDLAQEPLPSRFTDLLDQLKQGAQTNPASDKTETSDD